MKEQQKQQLLAQLRALLREREKNLREAQEVINILNKKGEI